MSKVRDYYVLSNVDISDHVLVLHDAAEPQDPEINALVASGDYFATLATTLDQLQQQQLNVGQPEAPEIEKIVRTLFYLDRHYVIRKKPG